MSRWRVRFSRRLFHVGAALIDYGERLHENPTPCQSYGGTTLGGRVRLCTKPRWHTDSHTYEMRPSGLVDTYRIGMYAK